jgi:hypothetical protein
MDVVDVKERMVVDTEEQLSSMPGRRPPVIDVVTAFEAGETAAAEDRETEYPWKPG